MIKSFAALLVDLVDDVGEKLAATLASPPYSSVRWLEYLEMKAHNHVANACMDLDDIDASLLGSA